MLIECEWRETPTTVRRPYLRAHLEAQDGTWVECIFLVDTGADRTVLSADVGRQLGRPTSPSPRQLGGIGGAVETNEVLTRLRLSSVDGSRLNVEGSYGVFVDQSVGESILGYDILHQFVLIVDRPGGTVLLISPPHRYNVLRS